MKAKAQILDRMTLYRVEGGGIGSWLTESTSDTVFERLGQLDKQPLSAVQLNQLLVLAHEAPVSDGFFRYYWLEIPKLHPYDVRALPDFSTDWTDANAIQSLDHLAWGLYRLYVDGLLYFGNVRTAFRALREFSHIELEEFFSGKRFDTEAIKRRGPPLPLKPIDREKRYLISEMACKSYGDNPKIKSDLRTALTKAYAKYAAAREPVTTIRNLLEDELPSEFEDRRVSLTFAASEILDERVSSQEDVDTNYLRVASKFDEARRDALKNTEYYLSMLTDLDVYVATSMRTSEHFIKMAQTCESIFSDERLTAMNLRYFDPTMSAANGHEDKGLIECLMVKCAKALVYCGGEKESYGKDAEAAMALSLGRPVIFYCEQRTRFYREVHPLTRLIHFETGVAVGAMVTDKLDQVIEILSRTFENRMIYRLDRSDSGSLRLKEEATGSVVRLQTSDKLLTETFWNHYHQDRNKRPVRTIVVAQESNVVAQESNVRRISNEDHKQPSQTKLRLEDTSNLLPLAARNSANVVPLSKRHAKEDSIGAAVRSMEVFPLSTAEVFDGVSQVKRNQATGAKRFAVFSDWLEAEGIGIVPGLKLLRFIEATLNAEGARSNFVYKVADLTRWYREMSDGAVVGS